MSMLLYHWYPGSGVVLDCIDSWSLPSFLLFSQRSRSHILKSLPTIYKANLSFFLQRVFIFGTMILNHEKSTSKLSEFEYDIGVKGQF